MESLGMEKISGRPEELRAHFWIPAGNKTKLNKTVVLKNTFPSLSKELVCAICLPLNIFSSVLAEFQEDGVQSPFIPQAKEIHEVGRNKAGLEKWGHEEAN